MGLIKLTESDLHCVISECVKTYLLEEYGKWFQTEKNNIPQVAGLMKEIRPLINHLDNLSPEQVWEVIRKLGYINHSAFKVKPGMWDLFPDEMLSDKDFRLNKSIYNFKERALELLVGYYLKHGYDVSADEKRSMIAFREPTTGVRQVTFHVGKNSILANKLERNDATWDGVKQAHHYQDDESYQKQRLGESVIYEAEEGNMEPTLAWAKQKYAEFNAKYFDNFLPKCTIKVTPLGESGGKIRGGYMKMTSTKGAIMYNGANTYYDQKNDCYLKINKDTINKTLKPVIVINSNYCAPEALLENTLIHEMCHFYTWFNPDGSIRIPDKDNDLHGKDFMQVAEMISQKSGDKIQIKKLIDAEEIKQYSASSNFNKDAIKICVTEFNGRKICWFTKYNFWIKYEFAQFRTNEIQITQDNQVLMLLKRYRYSANTLRNNKLNAYYIDDAPQDLINAFENANYVTITPETCDSIIGET